METTDRFFYLKHFSTKTITEYIEKIKRGFADSENVKDERFIPFMVELFFKTRFAIKVLSFLSY